MAIVPLQLKSIIKSIIKSLHTYKQAQKLSYAELARRIGVSTSTLWDIMSREHVRVREETKQKVLDFAAVHGVQTENNVPKMDLNAIALEEHLADLEASVNQPQANKILRDMRVSLDTTNFLLLIIMACNIFLVISVLYILAF